MHNLEFWLDKPFRVLLVLIGAVVVSAVVRLLIRKVTRGIARGTQSRIVKRLDHGQSRWVQDAGVASERQALRARTIGAVLASVATIIVWAIAILMIISELGFNIAPVIASAGIAGVALSFGPQSLVKGYLSGLFMAAGGQPVPGLGPLRAGHPRALRHEHRPGGGHDRARGSAGARRPGRGP